MPSPPDPDAEVMLRVKRGDMAAFEELVNKYKQPVIHLAYRSIRDLAEAEDLAQNVFIQVFKSAHRYEASARFATWLFTIARNLCLNEVRRRSRHRAESIDAPALHEDQPVRQYEDSRNAPPPEALLRTELEDKVAEALGGLPENQRTAIVLCQQAELSYEEIPRFLGTTLSATKSRIHR
mgnify:CR=1 FL=1